MASNFKRTNVAVNAEANAVGALCNGGTLRLYSGTQSSAADAAVSTACVLLAELTFASTAFAAASSGVILANAIGSDTAVNSTGTATWFRAVQSNSTTWVFDGSVGTANADLILTTTDILSSAVVSCTSFSYTANKG
jgi:hypothetical protein